MAHHGHGAGQVEIACVEQRGFGQLVHAGIDAKPRGRDELGIAKDAPVRGTRVQRVEPSGRDRRERDATSDERAQVQDLRQYKRRLELLDPQISRFVRLVAYMSGLQYLSPSRRCM